MHEVALRQALPAGFWRRFLAYEIDWLLLAPIMLVLLTPTLSHALAEMRALVTLLQDWMLARMLATPTALPSLPSLLQAVLLDPSLFASAERAIARISLSLAKAALLGAGAAGIYFICFEASQWQATPGKRLLGITVVDNQGERLGWRRASLRFLAGSLSWMSFNLGHALAAWSPDGRALHDMLAGTLVLARTALPRWARWLLYAQGALLLGLLLGVIGHFLWQLAQLAEAGLL